MYWRFLYHHPKKPELCLPISIDFMFESYDKPKSVYFVVEDEGKIIAEQE
jgi:hypothetical protein